MVLVKCSNNRVVGKGGGGWYGIIMVVGIAVALVGVMGLHKMRDKRLFSLIIQEKHRDLLSLQLQLQKERESIKEANQKYETIKEDLDHIKYHKIRLTRKLIQMEAVAANLEQKHKILRSTLFEKLNLIKTLKDKELTLTKVQSELTALKEQLKQKNVKGLEIKQRTEAPQKVWSVSLDDPSNPCINSTSSENSLCGDKVQENKESDGQLKKDEEAQAGKDMKAMTQKHNIKPIHGSLGQSQNLKNKESAGFIRTQPKGVEVPIEVNWMENKYELPKKRVDMLESNRPHKLESFDVITLSENLTKNAENGATMGGVESRD
ncbi:hypothetical protein AMTRI_Chr02g218830 [Amborella trichopoda]